MLGKKQPAIDNQVANRIFRQLDWESLLSAARVSKDWRRALFQPFFTTFETLQSQVVKQGRDGSVKQTVAELPALFSDKVYSYQTINEQANQLAHYLISLDLPAESRIGLYMNQSLEYVVSVLAVMKAGLCFVPLSANPKLPKQRLVDYTSGCDIKRILTTSALREQPFLLEMKGIPCECVDTLSWLAQPKTNPEQEVKAEQLAYILNTSGSTGKPKKVLIEHKGLNYCMLAHHDSLKMTSADRVAAFADISFDAHIVEIMMTLGQGACLYIVPFEQRTDLVKLAKYYQTHAITVAIFTPSMLRELNPKDFPQLRVIISTGEKLDTETLSRWCIEGREPKSPRLFLNGYGPSEVTIATTLGVSRPGEAIHIGKPLAGLELFILEQEPKDLKAPKRMPVGEEGEIYIAGFGLARGYLDEALTKQRFRVIAHPDKPHERMRVFQTRDAGRITVEGKIEILGRLDRQLKVYGQLAYPEEVEAVLKEDTNVEQVYVDAKINQYGHPQFTAYLTLKDKVQGLDLAQLYKTAVTKLPPFMLPSRWYVVERIPFSASGKLDTKALQAMELKPLYLQGPSDVKPQDKLERELADIWRQILRIEDSQFQFHVDDNFFHLGGTSLQAASLLQKLRSQYRLRLTPTNFMQAPTIAALVRRINRQVGKTPKINKPVLLQAGDDTNTPLFLVHSLMGDPEQDYAKLMEHWQSNRAVYGIKARGFANPQDMDDSLHALAADYIEAIKDLQSNGPYLIGGWSAGGDIALVMAELLRGRGEQVALLMIDSEAITTFQAKSREEYAAYLLDLFEKKLKGQLETTEHGLDTATLAQWPKEKQVHVLFKHLASAIHSDDINLAYKQGLLATIKNILLGMLNHPVAANSQGLLITAQKTEVNLNSARLQWPEFVRFDEVISLSGDHESILLSEEGAKQMAHTIAEFCAKQQAQFTSRELTQTLRQVKQYGIDADELKYYIPARGCRNNNYQSSFDLEAEVNKFLAEDKNKKVMLMLGNSGTGKSLFSQYMANRLIETAGSETPLVLYIVLPSFDDPTQNLIEKQLKRYGLNDEQIKHLKAHQKFIFILDGYDEIKTGLYQNLYISNNLAEWNAKVIITCRSSYLINAQNYKLHFVPNKGMKKDEAGLTEVSVVPFTQEQIESYINRYLANMAVEKDEDAQVAWEELPTEWRQAETYKHYINMLPGVQSLITTPFLLHILMKVLPKVAQDYEEVPANERLPLTVAKLYDYFAAYYFERQETKLLFRNELPADGRDVKLDFEEFSKQLAFMMWQQNVTQVSYQRQSSLFANKTSSPWEQFFSNENPDMKRAREGSPLKHLPAEPGSRAERFAFLHYSLQEYFASTEIFEQSLERDLQAVIQQASATSNMTKPASSNSPVPVLANQINAEPALRKNMEMPRLYQVSEKEHGKKPSSPGKDMVSGNKTGINYNNGVINGLARAGLDFIPIPGDGHCLYTSVSLYLGEDPAFLRSIVAAHLEFNKHQFSSFITLPEGKSLDDYINAVRNSREWADNIEIEVLMRVLNRPILIIGADGQLINLNDKERFADEPIFVYYNGIDHYDALTLKPGLTAQTVLANLKNQPKTELKAAVVDIHEENDNTVTQVGLRL